MGSIISKINDDYDDYKYFCKILKVESMNCVGGFYEHQKELLNQLGFKCIEDYYAMLSKAKNRENNINDILND